MSFAYYTALLNNGSAVIENCVQISCSGLAEQLSSPESVQAGAQISTLDMPNMDTTQINHLQPFCSTSVAVPDLFNFHRVMRQCQMSPEAWLWRQTSNVDMLVFHGTK